MMQSDKIFIEYTFSNDKIYLGSNYEKYMGKKFIAEVLYISDDEIPDYGVCVEYGQDLIASNKCKIINDNTRNY